MENRTHPEDWNKGAKPPDEWRKGLFGVLGVPVEYDSNPMSGKPWITWFTAFFITIISLVSFIDIERSIELLGLVPSEVTKYGGFNLLSSFFVHAGIFHLVGNLYYLLVFGDNVEDVLGKWRFFYLILSATLVGAVFHVLGAPSSTTPCIGSSGGVSGLVSFYALRFPSSKLGLMFIVYFRVYWFKLSAFWLFVIWTILQLYGVWGQLGGFGNTSYLAHVGGALVGVFYWFSTKDE